MSLLPRTGITLYSFTPEFHAGTVTLPELIARAGDNNLGPGLEIVGFQSIRGFPQVEDEFAGLFRELVERHGLTPSCLGANADVAMRSDRMLTDDELTEYLAAQLRAAAKLGFPVVRMQYSSPLTILRRLLPLAERLEVKMGVEIHSPETVNSGWVLEQREFLDAHPTPWLGFIPDFGASTRALSPRMLESFRAKGVSEELLGELQDAWSGFDPDADQAGNPRARMSERARELGAADSAVALGVFAFGIHGRAQPRDWLEIADQVVHVHAKFFEVTEEGSDPAVPLSELVDVFVEGGYDGFFSTEYEGWHWDLAPDALEMVTRQQDVLRQALARHEVAA